LGALFSAQVGNCVLLVAGFQIKAEEKILLSSFQVFWKTFPVDLSLKVNCPGQATVAMI